MSGISFYTGLPFNAYEIELMTKDVVRCAIPFNTTARYKAMSQPASAANPAGFAGFEIMRTAWYVSDKTQIGWIIRFLKLPVINIVDPFLIFMHATANKIYAVDKELAEAEYAKLDLENQAVKTDDDDGNVKLVPDGSIGVELSSAAAAP